MDENIILLNHIGDHYAEANHPKMAALYFKKATEVKKRSEIVRQSVFDHQQLSKDKLIDEADEEI